MGKTNAFQVLKSQLNDTWQEVLSVPYLQPKQGVLLSNPQNLRRNKR